MARAGYDPVGSRCFGGPRPGTMSLRTAAMERWDRLNDFGIYNCLAGETLVMTPDGDVRIDELVGMPVKVLSRKPGQPGSGKWVEAEVRSFGDQHLWRVVLSRHGVQREVFVTADHRWYTQYRRSGADGGGDVTRECTTTQLRPRMALLRINQRPALPYTRISHVGVAHGLVTGDGTVDARGGGRIALHGAKNVALLRFFPPGQVHYEYDYESHAEPFVTVMGLPRSWKRPAPLDEDVSYLAGWLAGLFGADGSVSKGGHCTLYNTNVELLEHVKIVCRRLGVGTMPIKLERKDDNSGLFGKHIQPLWSVSLDARSLDGDFFIVPEHRARWSRDRRKPDRWRVVSVEETDRVEEVYCAIVPGTECFALADNILTGNCRNVGGTRVKSAHAEGRAWDAGCTDRQYGLEVANTLVGHHAQLGIQTVIWWRRIWIYGQGWDTYGGESPHTDHLHIEQNNSGADDLRYAEASRLLRPPAPPLPRKKAVLDMPIIYSNDANGEQIYDSGSVLVVLSDPKSSAALQGAGVPITNPPLAKADYDKLKAKAT